jgi:hypothetical protein
MWEFGSCMSHSFPTPHLHIGQTSAHNCIGILYELISAINSTTARLTLESLNSNSAAIRSASAESAILRGLEVGGSVWKGRGLAQVGASNESAEGE